MIMPTLRITTDDKIILLQYARQALEHAVRGETCPEIDLTAMPDIFVQKGATFVTLIRNGELRGCVGTLEAYQSLILDVGEHAVAAALKDFRFPPVQPAELNEITIEISRLTAPVPVMYRDPEDLISLLRPGTDGVLIKDGWRRATFLPQVWKKLPDPSEFLYHLCMKMGAVQDLWRTKRIEVFTYEVEEFHE